MDVGLAILVIGVAAAAAAFCLLLVGLVYSEAMNCDVPSGVESPTKLHAIHCFLVGMAMVGRILERLGLCDQSRLVRWLADRSLRRRGQRAGLRIKNATFAGVPVRVYEPTAASAGKRRGLVYFHGGGWVVGSLGKLKTRPSPVCYRLAPEHRYPAHLDDCEAATRHFLTVAEASFGVDPRRVAVGGDSAGGNLAAALCQRLAKKENGHLLAPCAQVLIYPALQMADFSLPSYQQNHAVPLLLRGRMAFYFLHYLNGDMSVCQDVLEGRHVPAELMLRYRKWLSPDNLPAEFRARGFCQQTPPGHDGEVYHIIKAGLEPEVSPLLAEDDVVRSTPPAFILTCEYDVLRDDGILYAKRLKDLGVPVTWQHIPDGFHGIINFRKGWLSFPSAERALDSVVRYLENL
uniref:Alpha/beta hydrolase fold-3 domain-containing protein n=1 Tax=Denticeps clupeoides TaxID=299321 RepID=A0AAY4ERY0_9TELE